MDALAVLQRLGGGNGRTIERLGAAIEQMAKEVTLTGKPAKVVLTLTISNEGQGETMIFIGEAIQATPPKREGKSVIFYADEEGGLYQHDPRQISLPFREVDQDTGEIREVETPEREERVIGE